jgi:hypothetical protein
MICPAHAQGKEELASEPIQTNLCDVVANSAHFSGKRVRFRATVLSDGLEHTVLVDPKCKGGIVPVTTDQSKDRPDVKALDRAVAKGKQGTDGKRITAVFTGLFKYDEGASRQRASRVVELEKITNLRIITAADDSSKVKTDQ